MLCQCGSAQPYTVPGGGIPGGIMPLGGIPGGIPLGGIPGGMPVININDWCVSKSVLNCVMQTPTDQEVAFLYQVAGGHTSQDEQMQCLHKKHHKNGHNNQ